MQNKCWIAVFTEQLCLQSLPPVIYFYILSQFWEKVIFFLKFIHAVNAKYAECQEKNSQY